ncbi:MAG TPA: OsmC family protein [Candidatus Saccharimonadales bacterium]|nr:OsmC family protein [Candidatus Saccharimonadales bacterium]
MSEPELTSPGGHETARGPKLIRNMLTARNDQGLRTVVSTGGGLTLAIDEPVVRGGTGSAPTPLETVVGALCGCTVVTFARAASELGFAYAGIDFDAEFTLDRRGLLGEADVRPHFQTVEVEARVRTAETPGRLQAVVEVTERRCPVRNLLVDAGVSLTIKWVTAPAG